VSYDKLGVVSGCEKLKQFISANSNLIVTSSLALFVRVLGALSSFVLSVIIARKLGPEEAGLYFIAFNLIVMLSAFSRCGFDDVLLRMVSVSSSQGLWNKVKGYVITSSAITFLIATLVAMTLYFLSEIVAIHVYSKPELSDTIRAISPAIIGLALLTLGSVCLQSLGRVVHSIFILNILVNLSLSLVVGIGFSVSSVSSATALSIFCICTAVVGFLLFSRYMASVGPLRIAHIIDAWCEIKRPAAYLWVVLVLSQFVLLVGQFFSGMYATPSEAAYFAVAQRSAMLVSFVLMAVNLVVAPQFARLYGCNDIDGIKRLAITSTKLMLVAATPMSAAMYCYPTLVLSLFGADFEAGAKLLQILVVGQFFSVASGSVVYILLMSGGERELRKIIFFVAPFSVFATFIFTISMGVIGSAIGSSLTLIVQSFIAVYYVNKRFGFNTLKIWTKL
jgi:O-antigen/teichoic acid export membrane protein